MKNKLNWSEEISMLLDAGFEQGLDPEHNDGLPVKPLNEGDVVFYHKSWTRQNIAVMLCLISEGDDQKDFIVYVRRNIGCGWIMMPYLWCDLQYWFLNSLKISLDCKGLKGEQILH